MSILPKSPTICSSPATGVGASARTNLSWPSSSRDMIHRPETYRHAPPEPWPLHLGPSISIKHTNTTRYRLFSAAYLLSPIPKLNLQQAPSPLATNALQSPLLSTASTKTHLRLTAGFLPSRSLWSLYTFSTKSLTPVSHLAFVEELALVASRLLTTSSFASMTTGKGWSLTSASPPPRVKIPGKRA